ncbi:MAG: hypothetical protein QOH48_773 [Actinomycetota bacterium]|nr:hypothetical protein [Actinomycetota bacterium]
MDPEQIYAEVLSEEQQKGSSAAVAEGRAKAARARAEAGSPTPKEAKWWPGAQAHLEGGEAPAAAEEAPAEEVVAEVPAPEPAEAAAPSAAEAPIAAAAPPVEPAAAPPPPAAPVPQEPAAATPPPAPVSAPVPVAAASVPTAPAAAQPLPPGVSAGTTTGTRLRPEDESATEAQFEGQQAMYERRKLIDDLVSTGVPVVTASDGGGSRGGAFLLFLYLLIPIVAIAILAGVNKGGAAAPAAASSAPTGPTLIAQNVQFTTSSLNLPANQPITLHFENKDSTPHNVGIYDKKGGKELFRGSPITGPTTTDYKISPVKPGTYYFQCDIHPESMNGSVTVK